LSDAPRSDAIADDYDQFQVSVPHYQELQSIVGQIVGRAVGTHPLFKIVEAGTGTGATTRSILSAHPTIQVTSVDPDVRMLDRAITNSTEFSNRVKFVCDDILTYLRGHPSQSLDAFVSAYTLHNLDPVYRAELLPEIARVLKDGAVYVNADKIARNDQLAHERDLSQQIEAFQVYEELGRADLRRYWTDHYRDDELIRIVERDHLRALTQAGFTRAQVVWRMRMEAIVTAVRQTNKG
jgi:ubiquinone/menaquinone biosynthesis C-methylase UbiE